MKAVKIYQAGGAEQLIYQDVPTPDLKEGWSLVKIKGFGINHSEIFTREGKSPSVQFPRILGIECVGEVTQSSTPALAVGQKVVFYYGRNGARLWRQLRRICVAAKRANLPHSYRFRLNNPCRNSRNLLHRVRLITTASYRTARSCVLVRGAGSSIAFAQLLKVRFLHIVFDW